MYKTISMLFLLITLTSCAHEKPKPKAGIWYDAEGHAVWIRAMDDQYA